MDFEYDVYNYDKSQFFTLLESPKFRAKYNLIQEQQGIIVCPLDLLKQPNGLSSQTDLIDRHLFLPSPFYKNHYLPLVSLNTVSTGSNSFTDFSINLNPLVYLIFTLNDGNDESDTKNTDTSKKFFLIRQNRHICRNVKLLNVQTAYAESNKQYMILIVNKELYFKMGSVNKLPRNKSLNQIAEDSSFPNNSSKYSLSQTTDVEDDDDLDAEIMSQLSEVQRNTGTNEAIKRRRVSIVNYTFSLNDVATFQNSIDFMQNTVFLVDEADFLFNTDEDQNDFENTSYNRRPKKLCDTVIGELLLSELDLFKKTYIILPTHIADCAKQLSRIYEKYVRRFLRSYTLGNKKLAYMGSDIDLSISVACENTIIGCMYTKLWPVIFIVNKSNDELFHAKCKSTRSKLFLDRTEDHIHTYNISDLNLWSTYFQLDRAYFNINFKSILKEIKKLSMINNPFESMNCIKTCIDLLTNELTISIMKLGSGEKQSSPMSYSVCVTSETLIPLLAFILLQSNIDCLKSIVYFIDMFSFSSQPSQYSNAWNTILISELTFFMTSFKAAIQLIENI